MSFFRVVGVRGFNGQVVEGLSCEESDLVEIRRIINLNAIVGDRNVTIPIDEDTLYIHRKALVRIEDPERREFGSDNPWGKCLFEGRYTKDNLEIAYARFENATQATVTEKVGNVSKTLYTGYFLSGDTDFDDVKDSIEGSLVNGDVEDLIFELRQLDSSEEE